MDEGYIRFQVRWQAAPPLPWPDLQELNHWRNRLYDAGLIGAYDNGVGFGNISCRTSGDHFCISGSATGHHHRLSAEYYSLVTEVDLDNNTLACRGPIIASSESMSHAVIYRQLPWVQGVIHGHHRALWQQLLHRVPTTAATAAYGTPEMAYSILDLLRHTDLPERRLFVMEGHPEGLFAFGRTLEEAGMVLLRELEVL